MSDDQLTTMASLIIQYNDKFDPIKIDPSGNRMSQPNSTLKDQVLEMKQAIKAKAKQRGVKISDETLNLIIADKVDELSRAGNAQSNALEILKDGDEKYNSGRNDLQNRTRGTEGLSRV